MAERRVSQIKVPELDSPRMIGAGTQFRLTLTAAGVILWNVSFSSHTIWLRNRWTARCGPLCNSMLTRQRWATWKSCVNASRLSGTVIIDRAVQQWRIRLRTCCVEATQGGHFQHTLHVDKQWQGWCLCHPPRLVTFFAYRRKLSLCMILFTILPNKQLGLQRWGG